MSVYVCVCLCLCVGVGVGVGVGVSVGVGADMGACMCVYTCRLVEVCGHVSKAMMCCMFLLDCRTRWHVS